MKTALICGTKENSIGRVVAKKLHEEGWEVWLYGRSGLKKDSFGWHERKCDLMDEASILELFLEIKSLDFVLFSSDSGTAYGEITNLNPLDVKNFVDSKIITTILLVKNLLKKFSKIKCGWCAGSLENKPNDLILYSIVNNGLMGFINEINNKYGDKIEAYYIPTPLVSPSTLGNKYLSFKPEYKKSTQKPDVVSQYVLNIVEGKYSPGIIHSEVNIL